MTVTRITTITTPAANRNLATRQLFKFGPKTLDSANDEYIDFLLASKSRAFEQMCNRVFASEGIQDVFRIRRPICFSIDGAVDPLILSRRPVTVIASVVDYTGTLDPSLYEVDGETGFLTRLHDRGDGTFVPIGWRPGAVTVNFTAGYLLPDQDNPTLPEDIQEAVCTLARAAYKAKDRDPALRSQGDGGIGNQAYWLGTPPDVAQTAANYRDPKFGG